MNIKLQENIDITNLSSFRTKASTRYYFEINNENDVFYLKDLWRFCEDNNLWFVIIWRWTNVFFAFEEFNWVIVKNNLKWWHFDKNTKILEAYSNEPISNIALSLKNEYSCDIWERFIWLPWWIWWAIFWNAWCFGLETWNNFLRAKLYNMHSWQIEFLNKSGMDFWYRTSYIKENSNKYFIISAKFDLSRVEEKYSTDIDIQKFRKERQPKGFSCWSFFRNPDKENPAGKLIEEVGLKWYKIWWAFFSLDHANFLMSDWTATYRDILELMNLAQTKVKEEKGFDLLSEVRIIENGKN